MERSPIIAVDNIYKSFKDTPVLQGVSLNVYQKETVGIIGKSGVGKSLILKHIIGLMRADAGQVLVNGVDVGKASRGELEHVRSKMGFLFQNAALFDSLTVFENVALPLRETTKLSETQIQEKVKDLLDHVGLIAAREKFPPQLSGGMRKRVGLARALVNNPDIILFDEPTTGLDPLRKNSVHELIAASQRHHGFAAVIVSHEIPDIFTITDRIAMLDEGKIVVDTPSGEFERVTNEAFLNFLSGVQSIRCPHTGLLSRVELDIRLAEECARGERYGQPFSVVLVQVQSARKDTKVEEWHFELAYVLRKQVRLSDVIARYDDRTFAMILPGTPKWAAEVLARRISEIASSKLADVAEGATPRVSVGWAEFEAKKTPEQLVREALNGLIVPGERTPS
ncbi:MAG: ATP-binding cassette domain-containing protein [Deltaproteobacteria bacterium]|nr:ATP-binding cassette domain-containing protein [Deltaproteobacteria bacterium]